MVGITFRCTWVGKIAIPVILVIASLTVNAETLADSDLQECEVRGKPGYVVLGECQRSNSKHLQLRFSATSEDATIPNLKAFEKLEGLSIIVQPNRTQQLCVRRGAERVCDSSASEGDQEDASDSDQSQTKVALSSLDELRNLKELNLIGISTAGLSSLQNLNALEELRISGEVAVDVSSLSGFKSLRLLSLSGPGIQLGPATMRVLSQLPSLTDLAVKSEELSDISGIGELRSLTSLGLASNQLVDIAALATLPNLSQLSLAGRQIEDLTPLHSLRATETINLSRGTEVPQWLTIRADSPIYSIRGGWYAKDYSAPSDGRAFDVTPLGGLPRLKELFVTGGPVTGLANLRNSDRIEALYLRNVDSEQTPALSKFTSLEGLTIDMLEEWDLSPLSSLTSLQRLSLPPAPKRKAPKSGLSALDSIRHSPVRGDHVELDVDLSALSALTELHELRFGAKTIGAPWTDAQNRKSVADYIAANSK